MALKKKVYTDPTKIKPGEWIYFKNTRVWEGPVKVTTKSGKLLYAVRMGQLLTINTDHAPRHSDQIRKNHQEGANQTREARRIRWTKT